MKISRLSIRGRLGWKYISSTVLHSPRVKLVGLILTLISNLQLTKIHPLFNFPRKGDRAKTFSHLSNDLSLGLDEKNAWLSYTYRVLSSPKGEDFEGRGNYQPHFSAL